MYIVINGIRYHVEVCGDGLVPLVLLHGFTGDSTTWANFHEWRGQYTKLIIPDIIGHGKTDSPDELSRYHIEAAATDLKDILDQIGVKQVDLLGYSMGGRLALTFALLFPESVRKLILESSSPGLATEDESQQRRMKDAELAKFITEKGISAFVDYWEKISLFSTLKRLPLVSQHKIRQQRLKNSQKGLANSLLGMGTGSQPSWWGKLKELTCEVLLITGAEDQKFCDIADRMMKELKNSTWIVVEGSGHVIHVEDPKKFGTIVSDFLSNENI
ncbi:2-succinyl-6-hydroxy-2,4-cyclohexadiene-1-carboxylate synthase [Bacillaceae bacterium C204]|uniref:2-succinyl-6-hydroxy-2, 4-cyclohexadiene-1-carboxylate synthase n=1 Tax=Neobacillus sp. 204 TaxID=3383351 RepID=UPI00397BB9DC